MQFLQGKRRLMGHVVNGRIITRSIGLTRIVVYAYTGHRAVSSHPNSLENP